MSDPLHQFDVQLHQVSEVHTETFSIQAADKKDAKQQADKLCKDKGINKDYRLVVIDTLPEEPNDEGR